MKATSSVLVLCLPLLLLTACASHPGKDVQDQMARTGAVIEQAERSGVAVHALPELQAAKDKYAEAKKLVANNSDESSQKALQLAKQAEVDAQYATAKANSAKQATSAREVQGGVDALKTEAARNSAAPAPAAP